MVKDLFSESESCRQAVKYVFSRLTESHVYFFPCVQYIFFSKFSKCDSLECQYRWHKLELLFSSYLNQLLT